jgi:RNA polymerase sigma-70 factor (ECF subfamily)
MCVVPADPPTRYLGDLSDERLVRLFRAGADGAFAELDRRHRRAVCGYIGRMLRDRDDTEDIAQDVMLRAAAQLQRTSEPLTYLRAWLLRVARNRAIDLIRAATPTQQLPETLLAAVDPIGASADREELRHTLAVLRELPDAQRRALVLNSVHGVPFDEVARVLDTTPRAAKALAFRGRSNVRSKMNADLARVA